MMQSIEEFSQGHNIIKDTDGSHTSEDDPRNRCLSNPRDICFPIQDKRDIHANIKNPHCKGKLVIEAVEATRDTNR